MNLYITDNGTWGGTKGEMPAKCREDGSPKGGWRAISVPTDKAHLLAFLNHRRVQESPVSAPTRERPAPRPTPKGSSRYRVYGGLRERAFISSTQADSPEEACSQVAETLVACPS